METATLAGGPARYAIAIVAGGCFWCTEAIFKRLKGVKSVIPGYAGGTTQNPTYEQVSSGKTGHAEAIQIEFDPKIISFEKLLQIFLKLHDPTTLNKQGTDTGTQYRSIIFYHDQNQKEKAEKAIKKIEESKIYSSKIVTKIETFTKFYLAEDYHKNYYERNSYQPYCQIIIDPKIQKLYRDFKQEVVDDVIKN